MTTWLSLSPCSQSSRSRRSTATGSRTSRPGSTSKQFQRALPIDRFRFICHYYPNLNHCTPLRLALLRADDVFDWSSIRVS